MSIFAMGTYFSFVGMHDRADNGESDPESTTLLVTGFVGAVEAFEQFVVASGFYVFYGIPHTKDQVLTARVESQPNLPVFCGILDRIIKKQRDKLAD